MLFRVVHHALAKDLTQQTHIQVSLNQHDPPNPIYFGSARFFWDQGVGNFFLSLLAMDFTI
jgi:hypothetical protein